MDGRGTTLPSAAAYTAFAAGAPLLLIGLFFWERGSYVDYAEGVYLFSARLIVHGEVPYRDFIAAHPPLLFYSGAGIVAISDSLDFVRVVLSFASLATGALVAVAVARLTANGWAATVAGLLAIVAPWSVHEHATLMPETFAAPLLMAAAVLASRPRSAWLGGLAAAVAVGFKWPYLLPGLVIGAFAVAHVRYLAAFAAGVIAGILVSFVLFGADHLYQQLVVVQEDVGWHTLRQLGGLVAQAAWNLVPLLIPAACAVRLRSRTRDAALFRIILALAATTLIMVATVAKTGTYLNVIAAAEPAVLTLAVAGTVWLLTSRTRARALPAVVGAAWLLSAVQVIAFIAHPTHPGLFVRPRSAPAHAWTGPAEVTAAVHAAEACRPEAPYSGAPFIAFLAHRPMPAGQPDQFLLGTPAGATAARAVSAARGRCPAQP